MTRPAPIDPAKVVITTTAAAALIGVTPHRLRQLVREGWIKQLERDRFLLGEVVRGYLAFIRDEERRSSRSAAQNRVQEARAKQIELRTAREMNELIPMEG